MEQEKEVDALKDQRFDTSGSYIADLSTDVEGTIKYNYNKGNIGIYKHISADVLFKWTENAIDIIFNAINRLNGETASIIFEEMGQQIEWDGYDSLRKQQLDWYLTQTIHLLKGEEKKLSLGGKKNG